MRAHLKLVQRRLPPFTMTMAAKKRPQLWTDITTEEEWRELVAREGLVVVDVFSEWAGPCASMAGPLRALKLGLTGLAFERLHLAAAPADLLPVLQRFSGTSQPTFLLMSGGRLVNAIFSCDAPAVVKVIKAELERGMRIAEGQETRATVSLTRLCPSELARRADRLEAAEELRSAEKSVEAAEADRVLRLILSQIAENLPATTVVVFLPRALQSDNFDEVKRSLQQEWAAFGYDVVREERKFVSKEEVDIMFWERRLPQHDFLVESFQEGESLVLMLAATPLQMEEENPEETEPEEFFGEIEKCIAHSIYGFLPGTGSSMELLGVAETTSNFELGKLSSDFMRGLPEPEQEKGIVHRTDDAEVEEPEKGVDHESVDVEGEEQDEGVGIDFETDVATREEQEKGVNCETDGEGEDQDEGVGVDDEADGVDDLEFPRRTPLGDSEEDEGIPQVPVRVWNPRELLPAADSAAARLLFRPQCQDSPVLPGIWTPLTPFSKAAGVKALFPRMAEQLFKQPPPPPPPPPPTSVLAFSGDKWRAVLKLVREFSDEVKRVAYFTKDRQRLAATEEEYERLVRHGLQTNKTVMAVEVARVRSAPLLALSTLAPVHVSPNPALANIDVVEFFGPDVKDVQPDALQKIMVVEEVATDETQHHSSATPPAQAATHASEQRQGVQEDDGPQDERGDEEEWEAASEADDLEVGAGESRSGPGGEDWGFQEVREE